MCVYVWWHFTEIILQISKRNTPGGGGWRSDGGGQEKACAQTLTISIYIHTAVYVYIKINYITESVYLNIISTHTGN